MQFNLRQGGSNQVESSNDARGGRRRMRRRGERGDDKEMQLAYFQGRKDERQGLIERGARFMWE